MKADTDWIPLGEIRPGPGGRMEARVRLEPSSRWFSGHFEEAPVLPGVALLALAAETARREGRKSGRPVEILGFTKVRFRRLVFPGEDLLISVEAMTSGHPGELDFQVTCGDETVVHGMIRVT
jgi:3-hydroxymyristoyl/3-hydroxydecanoyl-(acyl carrier protein) dehydratase